MIRLIQPPREFSFPKTISVSLRWHGFSFIELMISLAILALIATVAAPMAQLAYQRSKEQDLRLALRQIRTAIDQYKSAYDSGRIMQKVGLSGYPASLDILEAGVDDIRSPGKKKIYFIRKIPRDPFSSSPPSIKNSETWGLRSYQSDASAPQKGDDVFDVYSMSEAIGLNGVPLKEW